MNSSLTDQEKRRYQYHLALEKIGAGGQEKIKKSRVIVIGAGGIGSPVLQYLTSTGFGTIGIVDFDQITESNLQRQILYGGSDIGSLKSIIAKQRLQFLNSMINYEVLNIRVNEKNVDKIIGKYDMVIDTTNNYETKYLLNDACVRLNKIFIFGAIYKFEGQVAVFNYNGGPRLRDVFPDPPACSQDPDMGILGVIPGIVGLFQVNEAIKIATGIGKVLAGKLLMYNAMNNDFEVFDIPVKL